MRIKRGFKAEPNKYLNINDLKEISKEQDCKLQKWKH